ncbi:ABC transporter permease [Nocardia stercoris]|uniref:Transport permease protein n=1 Tax=Nocardia stercoris TaxID=2483361 RepID=A0A3M2LCL8_9NOCA|nr:ABC transporter permease [Nocardia stercoris]RMI34323.1 ABC transporter permease [Nocardia stercoris]
MTTHIAADSCTMLGRNIRHSLRSPDSMVMTIALPITILLLFVYVFGGALRGDGHYLEYVVPGILLLTSGFGAATTAITVSTDLHNGIVDRFRTLAIARSAWLTGHVAASLLRNLLSTAVVVGVALAIGFRPTADPLRWLAVVALLSLFITALSWTAATLGLLAPNPEAAQGFTFSFMFLPYVSSAFVPPDTMPTWLRGFARHQPVTPMIETMRALLTGGPIADHAWTALAWWVPITVVGATAALLMFARRIRE